MDRHLPGDKVRVWVILKRNGKLVDGEVAHLIDTTVTNGWNSWFSRDPKVAVCGKKRRGNEGWRQAVRRNMDKLPDFVCEACQSLHIMMELAE